MESNSPTTAQTGNESSDFKAAIQESKNAIHEAAMQKVKGSRGRKPLPRDANGNIIREPASMGHSMPNDNGASPTLASQNQIDHSQLLIEPLKIFSAIPARKHEIEELAFNDEEAKALAQSLDKLFNAYFPDVEKMSPKAAAWISLGFVGVSLGVSKVSIYQAVMSERRKQIQKREAELRTDNEGRVERTLEGQPGSTTTRTGKIMNQNSFTKPDTFSGRV